MSHRSSRLGRSFTKGGVGLPERSGERESRNLENWPSCGPGRVYDRSWVVGRGSWVVGWTSTIRRMGHLPTVIGFNGGRMSRSPPSSLRQVDGVFGRALSQSTLIGLLQRRAANVAAQLSTHPSKMLAIRLNSTALTTLSLLIVGFLTALTGTAISTTAAPMPTDACRNSVVQTPGDNPYLDCIDSDCTGTCVACPNYKLDDTCTYAQCSCGTPCPPAIECCDIVLGFCPGFPPKPASAGDCGGSCDPGSCTVLGLPVYPTGTMVYTAGCL